MSPWSLKMDSIQLLTVPYYVAATSHSMRTILTKKSPSSTTYMKRDHSPDFTGCVDLWKYLHHSHSHSQSHVKASWSFTCLFVHVMWWGLCVQVWCKRLHHTLTYSPHYITCTKRQLELHDAFTCDQLGLWDWFKYFQKSTHPVKSGLWSLFIRVVDDGDCS